MISLIIMVDSKYNDGRRWKHVNHSVLAFTPNLLSQRDESRRDARAKPVTHTSKSAISRPPKNDNSSTSISALRHQNVLHQLRSSAHNKFPFTDELHGVSN